MAPRLQNLISSGSKKGTRIYHPFSQEIPASESPPGSPVGPQRERYPLEGQFYISLNISLIVLLSEYPVYEPPPCILTGSTRTEIIRHQSHWPSEGILFINLFIYSSIHVSAESPKSSPPTYRQEKHKVTVHGAPRRRKAYIQWGAAWFPKGIV